jgi:hypothetical protein
LPLSPTQHTSTGHTATTTGGGGGGGAVAKQKVAVYDAADYTVLVADTVDSLRIAVAQSATRLGFNGQSPRNWPFLLGSCRELFFFFFFFFSLSLIHFFFFFFFSFPSFIAAVVSWSSADEVLACVDSDALDIDIVLADSSVRDSAQVHVFQHIATRLAKRSLPVPPMVLVARDAAEFAPVKNIAACCLVRPVVDETLAACLDWVVHRRILKQSMNDLLVQRVLPVWNALVFNETRDSAEFLAKALNSDDNVSSDTTGSTGVVAPSATTAATTAETTTTTTATTTTTTTATPTVTSSKSVALAAVTDVSSLPSSEVSAATPSRDSPDVVASALDAPALRWIGRRPTVEVTSSAREIEFSDSSTSSSDDAEENRRASVSAMLRRRMPSYSARARSRQGTDHAMVLARAAVAMTKALEAETLDDELRADFRSIIDVITKHTATARVLPSDPSPEMSSASALDAVASRSADAATHEWLMSEYASVEDRFARRASAASFPSKKVINVIATDKLKAWSFDPFLETEHSLLASIPTMFETFELLTRFRIDRKQFEHFLTEVRTTYNNNPYHNFRHAFDVTQTVFVMLTTFDAAALLTHTEILGLLLAALCHDLDHPGVNNAYQVRVESELAQRYNDRSVLENYHGYMASKLLAKPKNAILANLDAEQRKAVRAVLTTAILGTDVSDHFEFLARFRDVMATRPNGLERDSADDRLLAVQMLLKAADISNVAKPWRVARKWGDVLIEEFFAQGDREKAEKLPPAAFMDRLKTTPAKVSINFIDYVAGVLFTEFTHMLPSADIVLQLMASNRRHLLRVEKKQADALGVQSMLDIERIRARRPTEAATAGATAAQAVASNSKRAPSVPAPAAAANVATATAATAATTLLTSSKKSQLRASPSPNASSLSIGSSPARDPLQQSSSSSSVTSAGGAPAGSLASSSRRRKKSDAKHDSSHEDKPRKSSSASKKAEFSSSMPIDPPPAAPSPRVSASAASGSLGSSGERGGSAAAVASGGGKDGSGSGRARVRRKKKTRDTASFSLASAISATNTATKQHRSSRAVTGGLARLASTNKMQKSNEV